MSRTQFTLILFGIFLCGEVFGIIPGYFTGKTVADKWWQQNPKPQTVQGEPRQSGPWVTTDPNPPNSWHNNGCPPETTLVIDEWPDPKQMNNSCIPRRALSNVPGININPLRDGDTVTLTHSQPRPANVTDNYSGWDLCNDAQTHCWFRNPNGTLSGEEKSSSKPEGKARGADGTVKTEIHKKLLAAQPSGQAKEN